MSEQLIHTLKAQMETLKSFLESMMSRFLAPITESVKRLPTMLQEQTKFVQKGFSEQIIYNLLIQINTINSKIKKVSKLKEYESKRINEKKKYLKLQVDELLEKLGDISHKLDHELDSRVKKLDKYALDFLDKTYNREVKNYLSEFEIPALEKIKTEEEAILSARVDAIEDVVLKINDNIDQIKEVNYHNLDSYTFKSEKNGTVLIKVLNVKFKKPNGDIDQLTFTPSRVTKSEKGIIINPLI